MFGIWLEAGCLWGLGCMCTGLGQGCSLVVELVSNTEWVWGAQLCQEQGSCSGTRSQIKRGLGTSLPLPTLLLWHYSPLLPVGSLTLFKLV